MGAPHRPEPTYTSVKSHGHHIQGIDRKIPVNALSLGDITHLQQQHHLALAVQHERQRTEVIGALDPYRFAGVLHDAFFQVHVAFFWWRNMLW